MNRRELWEADAAVHRCRLALELGDARGWGDVDKQREALRQVIAAEEAVARLTGGPPCHDLDDLRRRLADLESGG